LLFLVFIGSTEDEIPIIKAECLDSTGAETGVHANGFQCPTCQITFKYYVHLKHHLSTIEKCAGRINQNGRGKWVNKSSPHRCFHCNKRFNTRVLLRRHMSVHSIKESFQSPKCDRRYSSQREWNKHWKEHHSRETSKRQATTGSHSCPDCKKEFHSVLSLDRHVALHFCRKYACSICLQTFKHEHNFNHHTRKEHLFKCDHCKLAFPHRPSLDGHINMYHRKLISRSVDGGGGGINNHKKPGTSVCRRIFSCPECQKVFKHNADLRRHTVVHSNERPYVCSKCQHSFKYDHNFNDHNRKEHIHKCENCELAFILQLSLDKHVMKCHPEVISNFKNRTASNPRKLSCPECKKELNGATAFRWHMASIHSTDRPYVCSKCLQGFKIPNHHRLHFRKEHRFKCENCELSFLMKVNLEEHAVKSHQAVSRRCFSCPECKKQFIREDNLRAHMTVHSKEKPYVCSSCSMTFKWQSALVRHTQKQHLVKCESSPVVNNHMPSIDVSRKQLTEANTEEIRNKICNIVNQKDKKSKTSVNELKFSCPECNKLFRRSDSLRAHMVNHTNDRPYTCSHCLKTFRWSSDLYRHKRKEHFLKNSPGPGVMIPMSRINNDPDSLPTVTLKEEPRYFIPFIIMAR